ncbi:cysteine synthase A [Pseudobacteriovorax antillogorgiicola]|uniref:Cysteine synthase n=1 Tax=Pseudobacteriovorax antillogorgiicola TaxID=1513793 RepID=A0A1Y6BAB3_9BACT|nr:cysteine synthase A [Pseudobacteriovorax antillogorgiicola]TCS57435.1 cysteine synthase A [Pseudobacteriovorax antillogorgiicola]SMF01101.1 cysteine synthase A [Pseudobacteriovorax antillogorgiicola]
MTFKIANRASELIGGTSILKIESLSKLAGSDIFVKCEYENPGGSIKDRAALQMTEDALACGALKEGMTIVEGTAGNTGIGLAVVGKSLGFPVLVVMPRGQAHEKERMIGLFGAELRLVDPCPFKDPNHFYHTAKRIADEESNRYWWANQFENTSNYKAHYQNTGPEIWQQLPKLDCLVSVAGTGGTISGTSQFLKEKKPRIQVVLVDPDGSGLKSYVDTGAFASSGSSFTEGIGIMRLTQNFAAAKVDQAVNFSDQDILTISRFVRDEDGIVLGSSSALNVCAAFHNAYKGQKSRCILTFACDLGERSYSKLYDGDFLKSKGLDENRNMDQMLGSW